MSTRMRWLVGLGVLALCIVCGLLGLTAGINLNPESTVRFVPLWGSLADWVTGSGTLAAVVATVYYGWKQRQDLLPKLTMRASQILEENKGLIHPRLSVKLANPGHTPVEIYGMVVSSDNSAKFVSLDLQVVGILDEGSVSFPCIVGPGKEVTVVFECTALVIIKHFVETECANDDSKLHITAKGSIRDFSIGLDQRIARGPVRPFKLL